MKFCGLAAQRHRSFSMKGLPPPLVRLIALVRNLKSRTKYIVYTYAYSFSPPPPPIRVDFRRAPRPDFFGRWGSAGTPWLVENARTVCEENDVQSIFFRGK